MKTASVLPLIASFALALLLAACVSQSSVESRTADTAAKSDAVHRAQIHTELASAYYQRGQMSVALDEVNRALQESPTYVPAYNMRALVYMDLKEDAKAIDSFEAALRIAPGDSELLNNYGWFICQHSDPSRSLALFEAAVRNPLYTTPERAYTNAGVCSRMLGNEKEAERLLRTALKLQPNTPTALYHMADITYKQSLVRESEGFLARYNRATSNPTADALLLGVKVSRALGDHESENSYLQQLKRRFPEAPQTLAAQPAAR